MTGDLIVVGGGPAGYAGALRAAHHGLTVTLVEADQAGGVCLNRGCIPTKTMLHTAELVCAVRDGAAQGVFTAAPEVHYDALVERRDEVVTRLRSGVEGLLSRAGVELVRGSAQLVEHGVAVRGADGSVSELTAGSVLLATGSESAKLKLPGHDLPGVVDSDGVLGLDRPPARVVVVGGGAIGCEWAAIFAALGSEVVLLELAERLLPQEDPELGQELAKALRQQGVEIRLGTALTEIRRAADGLVCASAVDTDALADCVLLAAGRVARTAGLGLAELGVVLDERGAVVVDERMRTNLPWLSAAGDVTGKRMLAHLATYQAEVAADVIAGVDATARYDAVPSVTYTFPEVASVGLTEAQAREAAADVIVGRFPLSASGRAIAVGAERGFAKIVAEAGLRRVVGVHLVGPHAGELAAEAALAIELEATLEDLAATIHAHPTIGESLREAALTGLGIPLHVPRGSR